MPYRPNVTTSGRGKCSVLTGEPGSSTSGWAVAAGGSLRAQPARATAKRAATTYVYARHAPAADARGAWRCWGRLARRECGGASPSRAGNRKKETGARSWKCLSRASTSRARGCGFVEWPRVGSAFWQRQGGPGHGGGRRFHHRY